MAVAAPTRRRNYGRGHGYFLDGDKVSGVTTLIKEGMPSPALMYWSARMVAESAVQERAAWQEMDERDAVEWLRKRPWDRARAAAARGTEIHGWAEKLAKNETVEVPEPEQGHVDAFLQWWEDWSAQIVESELVVINRTHRYMGTVDLIADVTGWPGHDGTARVLIDISTSGSGVYPEKAFQVCAYANAEAYLEDPSGKSGEQTMASVGVDFGAVLWLRDGSYDFKPVEIGEATFTDFLYICQVAEVMGVGRDDPGRGEGYLGDAIDPVVTGKTKTKKGKG